MWSGTIASIPSGWQLADGTNGSPDLRNRFIVGAGSTYSIGNTGGNNTITLVTANLPMSAMSSYANYWIISGNYSNAYGTIGNTSAWDYQWYTRTSGGGGENMQYFKTLQSALTSAGWNSQPIDVRPSYFALAYIMKL